MNCEGSHDKQQGYDYVLIFHHRHTPMSLLSRRYLIHSTGTHTVTLSKGHKYTCSDSQKLHMVPCLSRGESESDSRCLWLINSD